MKHILLRLALIVLGLGLIGHALIHLGIIPGGMLGPDGKTGWSGHSELPDQFLGAPVVSTIAMVLEGGLLFAVVWTGILPHPSDAVFGPVISSVVLLGLLVDLLLEHTVLQPGLHHGMDRV